MNRRTRRGQLGTVALAMTVALGLAACADEVAPSDNRVAPATPASSTPQDISIPSDPLVLIGVGGSGAAKAPTQLGTAEVEVEVSSLAGGDVQVVPGRVEGQAFAFPKFTSESRYPRAVVTATGTDGDDEMSPGLRDFIFGADFMVDKVSQGRDEDNGNNLIQRGLSSDSVMFKLDLDANMRPGCTVKGRVGSLTVYARQSVKPGQWYRARCERDGERILVYVSEYLPSGSPTTAGRDAAGKLGAVTFPDERMPLAIGGKVARDGTVIRSETDQFNGRVENPFLVIM